MTEPTSKKQELSRRDFLKLSGVTGATVALLGKIGRAHV